MRRAVKIKALATHVPLRKAALSASPASRRPFPAWIAADESGVAFPVRVLVTPRVRDGLVLRRVTRNKASSVKGSIDARGAK